MPDNNAIITALREALEVSPDNVPLRCHLGETLLTDNEIENAEVEFRKVLSFDPKSDRAKLGLSRAYGAQGKNSAALVIVEDLAAAPDAPAMVLVTCAEVFLKNNMRDDALTTYRRALDRDPGVADSILAARLGITPEAARSGNVWEEDVEEEEEEDSDSFIVDGRRRQSAEGDDEDMFTETERPDIDFSAVGGMEDVKDEIRLKIILPMSNKELYATYGKKAGGGILLYGPPGCGKTHIARATAGEVKAGFMSIGLNDVLDMWIGRSEEKLHAIFEQARNNTPCVLFFDEVDALGASRSDIRSGTGGRHLINQFLAELDGVDSNNEGVLILAATNAPWHVDSAFRRPGRFDRVIFVPPPDNLAREEILALQLHGKPVDNVDCNKVARKLSDFSGADIAAIVDVTVEDKLRAAMQSGVPVPIATGDLLKASGKLKPTTKDWLASARNYALYSNESGLYDDVLTYLKIRK
ncbi:MAG: AAA family ATPase [Lentisphaeria bacterium]